MSARPGLGAQRVSFWSCLLPEHAERRGTVTVESLDRDLVRRTFQGLEKS